MKLKSYVFAALALSIMSGCSEDEITNNGTDGNQTEADNTAYVSVKITLPTSSSVTRVGEEPNYDNGTTDEWKVKDVTLLFFAQGDATTEDGYVLRNVASTLDGINTVEDGLTFPEGAWDNVNDNGDEVTVISAQTNVIGVAEDVTRVVALINISSEAGIAKIDLTAGKTFREINKALSLEVANVTGNNGFLMTSNPQLNSKEPAKAFNLTTCTPQATEDLAKKNMTTVSVERIVSKVELLESETSNFVSTIDKLQNETGSGWYKLGDENSYKMAYRVEEGLHHAGDIIVIEGWTLDVTNKKSFPFRKVDVATWSQGNSTVWDLISANTRMFFAVDPNYDGSGYTIESDFNTITTNTSFSENLSSASIASTPILTGTGVKRYPRYCLENTFNTDNQTKDQTTRLVIKAKYYPNHNTTGNSSESDNTWYTLNKRTAHYSLPALKAAIIEIANTENIFTDKNAEITLSDGVKPTVKSVVINSTTHDVDSDIVTKLNANLEIVCYQEGICYYPIRIRHFSDAEVYASNEAFAFVNGKYTDKELGRYGVVRNNSYRVQIKKISKPGDPVIPPTPDEPDDDENLYITCDIQILAWALRQVQDAEL